MSYSENANADKFYTDPKVAKECIDSLDLNEFDLIIEPSAGAWAFSRWLPEDKTYSFDLFPDVEWPKTIQQDFYEFDLLSFIEEKGGKNVLIIGNPPYGRLSSMAMDFVKKSCVSNPLLDIKTTVAFVVSETFMKESFARRIPTTHSLSQHKTLGSPFTVDDKPYTSLKTGWFVWSPIPRQKEVPLRNSKYLKFHSKEEFLGLETKDKCAIRGQGSRAGHVFWNDYESLSESTTRFCSGPGIHVLETIDWTPYTSLTIGIPSLSTSEIFKEIEKHFENDL